MRAAPTSASRRRGIGVGPACASWPVTVISYQRWPCAPVTMPIGRPAASRIGPCPICAVKPAAGRLRVEMAAGHDRRQVRIAAGSAREDVADLIDRDRAAGFLAPADKEAPRLAVEIACREPAHPAFRGGADPGQFHQARPQTLAVYLQIAHQPFASSASIKRGQLQLANHRRLIPVRALRCGIVYEALTASFPLERKIPLLLALLFSHGFLEERFTG